MKVIDVVNYILPYFGEMQVTKVSSQHPTVLLINQILQNNLRTVLARGWWFNCFLKEYLPDADGVITLPARVIAIKNVTDKIYTIRKQHVYDLDRDTDVIEHPVHLFVTEELEFEDLPRSMQEYLKYLTCYEAYVREYGNEDNVQHIQTLMGSAYKALEEEHLRNRQYRTTKSRIAHRYFRSLRS